MHETSPLLFSLAVSGTALVAGGLYRIHSWSPKIIWRALAFGSAILLASGFNLLIPSQDKLPLIGALVGFALFFALENYLMVHSCPEYPAQCQVHSLGILAICSLLLHSLFDGAILSISFKMGPSHFKGVFLGMAIHRLMDSLMLLALLATEFNWSFRKNLCVVMAISLAMPIGTILALLLLSPTGQTAMPLLAGISAGSLIYIAASDILPRIHRLKDPAALIFFLAGLALVGFFLH